MRTTAIPEIEEGLNVGSNVPWVISLAIIAVLPPSALAQPAQASAPTLDPMTEKVLIAIVSAVLSLFTGYILFQLKERREPKKRLSYDLEIRHGLLGVEENIARYVSLTYKGHPADQITYVRCDVQNTGNTVIKEQYLHFDFGERTQVLDSYTDPIPPKEFGVAETLEPALQRNRSGCDNRNHAAACDFCAFAGSRAGAASPRRAASHAAVRSSKTWRDCCVNVDPTGIILATPRAPSALCVPQLPLRHRTPGRSDRAAGFWVGSTPSPCTHVHSASRRFRMSRHVPAVLGPPHRLPAAKRRATSRRSGLMEERPRDRGSVPWRTRRHHVNLGGTCPRTASPISAAHPPRSRLASPSLRQGAHHP